MKAQGNVGALWLINAAGTPDLAVAARTATPAPDGGTYGYAANGVRADATLGPGDTGFVFTPPDAGAQPMYAGLLVLAASTGTVSVVGGDGTVLTTYAYDWPAGFQVEGDTIWDALATTPVSSGRIAFSVTTGKILPFGISFDGTTGDPTGLAAFGPKSADVSLTVPAVWRGGRALGASGGTDLQLFNAGSSTAAVTLAFLAATQTDAAAAPLPLPPASVPPGQVVTLTDVLAPLGNGLYGTIEVAADSAVSAFARVHAQAAAGGTYGYGVAGRPPGDAIPPTLRGVFVSASEPADVATHELLLVNPGDAGRLGDRQPLERGRHGGRNGDVRRGAVRDAERPVGLAGCRRSAGRTRSPRRRAGRAALRGARPEGRQVGRRGRPDAGHRHAVTADRGAIIPSAVD